MALPAMQALPENARIEALKSRHAVLSRRVRDEQNSPGSTDYTLSQLKKERLRLKEEIEGIRASG